MSLATEKLELKVEEAELIAQQQLNRLPPAIRWLAIGITLSLIPTYFITKSISHSYWKRQYAQYNVQAKTSFQNPALPSIKNTQLAQTGANTYSALITLGNENVELSARTVKYTVHFYNSSNEEIYKYDGNTFLLPSETKSLVVPRIDTKEKIDRIETEVVQPITWQKRLSITQIKFATPPPTIGNQTNPPGFVAEGAYTNSSPYLLKSVHLVFVLYDTEGKMLAASERYDSTIKPFERRAYKMLWPNVSGSNVARITVTAETNTLDRTNFTLPTDESNPASDLSRPEDNVY